MKNIKFKKIQEVNAPTAKANRVGHRIVGKQIEDVKAELQVAVESGNTRLEAILNNYLADLQHRQQVHADVMNNEVSKPLAITPVIRDMPEGMSTFESVDALMKDLKKSLKD